MHIRTVVAALAVAAVSMAAVLGTQLAAAQAEPPPGADVVISDQVAGPYRVRVSQSPARVIIGTVRLVVQPFDAETGDPVDDAMVRIFGTPPGEGERQYSPGLNSPTDRTLYFGQLELEEAGNWTIDVEIDAPQGRAIAITQTEVHERARSGSNTLIGTILFALISAAFAGGGTWVWYTSKKARERRATMRKSGQSPRRSAG